MSNQFSIDKEALNELTAMSFDVWAYIDNEQDAERAKALASIFGMFGEVLADVERSPIIMVRDLAAVHPASTTTH
ncbi:hypothetical protein [Pseudomonas anguilliseptica]|uniref:Uncharacterized protein n=1 Tax=Pseudomonas anguilliseptica TaxID=53406 RepID=A0A1H4U6I1_PSEAG|nr:hypothetical protein [Pseudomonas anguilliseptica]SEC64317.1 hypothetical protein SAMN05421553_1196 [Pseudomonas anguilliseptica]